MRASIRRGCDHVERSAFSAPRAVPAAMALMGVMAARYCWKSLMSVRVRPTVGPCAGGDWAATEPVLPDSLAESMAPPPFDRLGTT
eukprot:CAMPEP_0179079850 /NCGR_PEP_ID=MMETSP0796-20121207/35853_1 /TAXON_ID=73915 /ORGANISM="Pyrodinium bahamense, Strain pbaha01" /LENGTH=85 /DNA_ID=CAMNT_0020777195 /DNA_START=19 /DNA_END=276 /DNA_ORIENTATION=+